MFWRRKPKERDLWIQLSLLKQEQADLCYEFYKKEAFTEANTNRWVELHQEMDKINKLLGISLDDIK